MNVQVGDIFRATWGYEQTNVDHYKVKRVSKHSVWLVQVPTVHVEGCGMASDFCKAYPSEEIGGVFRRKLHVNGDSAWCSIDSVSTAFKVDPDSTSYRSWYH